MARALRIEYAGGLYHVMARGNRRERIYLDDADCARFLAVLQAVCQRFNWLVYAYCLMPNHYHLLLETPEPNLSRGMRQLNSGYTQAFRRRHATVGHLFQGRYKALLVQRERYLLELCRYIALNPVRAGLIDDPGDWRFSSYRAMLAQAPAPEWLARDSVLAQFASGRDGAVNGYARFVADGLDKPDPLDQVRHQRFLGDETFAARSGAYGAGDRGEVPRPQRRAMAHSLPEYAERYANAGEAMAAAYASGGYTMQEIARHFGKHRVTVSRAVKAFDQTSTN